MQSRDKVYAYASRDGIIELLVNREHFNRRVYHPNKPMLSSLHMQSV